MKSFLISIIILATFTQGQTSGIKSYCNPIDINYQYNFEQKKLQISYRSAADPVIINHKGEYFLFATISGGWWYSKDLLNWNFVKPDKWPVEDVCAPAAISVRDTLFLFQSTFSRRPIYFLTDPKSGHLNYFKPLTERLHDSLCGPWDPSLFYDEDLDKWYMYWGSSNVYPIYGDELDKNNQLNFKKYFKKLIYLHPKEHGWERFGYEHRDTIKPFIEGAWMTKHNKKYYLMYGAPGTEYNVYANGVYTSDHPLGPLNMHQTIPFPINRVDM